MVDPEVGMSAPFGAFDLPSRVIEIDPKTNLVYPIAEDLACIQYPHTAILQHPGITR